MARSKSNSFNNDAGLHLYNIADELGDDSPRIGEFRLSDGLKALSVGLVNGTAERLHGRPMSGVYQTLKRIGAALVNEFPEYAVTPMYRTVENEDGTDSLVYAPVDIVHNDGEIEQLLMPVKEKLQGFGFGSLAVYTTCMAGTELNSQGPSYTHSAVFSDSFYARGLDVYAMSPHCRGNDFPFHMEIIRGQLAMWAASRYMPDTSINYTHNLLKTYVADGLKPMLGQYLDDLNRAKLPEFVTT